MTPKAVLYNAKTVLKITDSAEYFQGFTLPPLPRKLSINEMFQLNQSLLLKNAVPAPLAHFRIAKKYKKPPTTGEES